MVVQWDDHEVLNNWYPGEVGSPARRALHRAQRRVLAARAKRAIFEYCRFGWPAGSAARPQSIARPVRPAGRGLRARQPQLPRAEHGQPAAAGRTETRMLGADAARLARARRCRAHARRGRSSPATCRSAWSCRTGRASEGCRERRPGAPLGREHELAALLSALQARSVRNVVWVTADVHYAAAHRYDPARARLHGLRSVLGVRRRAAPRGHLRAGRARRDVRPRARSSHVPRGPEAQPPAQRRAAVLRARGDRSGDPRSDGDAARPRRPGECTRRCSSPRPDAAGVQPRLGCISKRQFPIPNSQLPRNPANRGQVGVSRFRGRG